MKHNDPLELALAWQEAVNNKDVERLIELSDPNIEIKGPRGNGRGHDLLREWSERVEVTFKSQRVFVRDNKVVLAQSSVWKSGDVGDIMGTADVISRFRIENQRVVQYARYDKLDVALAEAGLQISDEIKEFRS